VQDDLVACLGRLCMSIVYMYWMMKLLTECELLDKVRYKCIWYLHVFTMNSMVDDDNVSIWLMIIIVVLLRGRLANTFTIHSLQDVTDMQISNHLFVLNLPSGKLT